MLEAFLLFFSKMSPVDLLDIVEARQESWSGRRGEFDITPLRHFFNGHQLPDLFKPGFILSSDKVSVELRLGAYVQDEVSEDKIIRRPMTSAEFKDKGGAIDFDDIALISIVKDGRALQQSKVMSIHDEIRILSRRVYLRRPFTIPLQYVSTSGLSNVKASALWDSISLTELEHEVVKGLQLIEPSATGVTFVAESDESNYRTRDGRIPLIKVSGIEEPIPLKSLGDGMTRVFHIILSLVCARNGVLIVDEFENGLHWSVQEGAWDIVFGLAKNLNVQVFTTTHSRDCIKSFSKSWRANPADGAFMRVARRADSSVIQEYDLELLSDSVDTDVEVR